MLKSKFYKLGKREQPPELPKYAQDIESNVEQIRQLAAAFQQGVKQVLFTKRNKKMPELQFSLTLSESLEKLPNDESMFHSTLKSISDIALSLFENRKTFEANIESLVCTHLNNLTDEICANVLKTRRSLNKASSDLSTAREQLNKANMAVSAMNNSKSSSDNQSSVVNAMQRVTQAQNLMDEKTRDYVQQEICLLYEVFNFESKEDTYAMLLVEHAKQQQAFYEKNVEVLKREIPKMLSKINELKPISAFYTKLPEHLKQTGRTISYVLETCISYLDNMNALESEGLFRIPGSHLKINMLVKALDLMKVDHELLSLCDSMTVASALKQYLDVQSEPLITFALAEQWIKKLPQSDELKLICSIVEEMPVDFRRNLAYLCHFLWRVASYSSVNKMDSENLARVFTPSLYKLANSASNQSATGERSLNGPTGIEHHLDFLSSKGAGFKLIELLIENADTLFKHHIPGRVIAHTSSSTTNGPNSVQDVSLPVARPPPLTQTSGNKKKTAPKPPCQSSCDFNNPLESPSPSPSTTRKSDRMPPPLPPPLSRFTIQSDQALSSAAKTSSPSQCTSISNTVSHSTDTHREDDRSIDPNDGSNPTKEQPRRPSRPSTHPF